MNDPWTHRLSEYMDGELTPAERSELDTHLTTCDACSSTLRELQAVVAAAAALTDEAPAADLWPAIAARLGTAGSIGPAAVGASAAAGVSAASSASAAYARRPQLPRRFSFSLPQLAAAAVVLMALSGSFVWLVQRDGDSNGYVAGTVVHTAAATSTAPSDVRQVGAESEPTHVADDDVAGLERTLDEHRDALDPSTVEVVERSLESIDRAIADARAALEADPGNENLHRQLDSTMRKKVELLRRVTRGVS